MKVKRNNGFVGVDAVISILAVILFSTLIISLMHNNTLENLKVRRETLATIYMTEIFENIGIATYDEVVTENISQFIPENLEKDNYTVNVNIETDLELSENQTEEIIKKVTATISYELGNKSYAHTMERTKIKE